MAGNKTIASAAFAAGLAAGSGGTATVQQEQIDAAETRATAAIAVVDQLDTHHPTIKTYISNAAEMTVTDVLDDRLPPLRADQLRQLAQDIEADITQGENVPLRDLAQTLAGKVRIDDPNWQIWYAQNFANYLQTQVQTGVAIGNLTYDQLVRLKDVTDSMLSVAQLHTPPVDPEVEIAQKNAWEEMERAKAEKAETLRRRGLIE
jgi:hypothetical protein